jgi:hypothetical protein
MPPRALIVESDKRTITQERYNEELFEYVDNLDLGCVLRLNVLAAVKKALSEGWSAMLPTPREGSLGISTSIPTDMGMVLMVSKKDHFDVQLLSVRTPAMVVPAKLRKTVQKYGHSELQNEQEFSPTIVRIKNQHAMEPSEIQVPRNLSASACNMLKNDVF